LNSLKLELGRLLVMSFGVFLFILFFQPISLEMLDYNNRLLFVTGFGAITLLVAFVFLILIPLFFPKWFNIISDWEYGPPLGQSILFLVFNTTAFAFYIRYVGNVKMSLYIMFKVTLVNLLPLITLILLYRFKSLKHAIGILQEQKKEYLAKIEEYENSWGENEIDIESENKSDNLKLKYKDIVYIKSADNYIELSYMNNGVIEKKLLRSTLRNIELQLVHQRNFLRSHRTCIVNILYLDKMVRSYGVYSLKLNCCDDTIPVSRQYLLQVKMAISKLE